MNIKVLQLGKYLPPHTGGIEKVTSQIIKLNDGKAEIVTICCTDRKKTEISVFSASKTICCPVICTVFSLPFSPGYVINALREIKKADAVHLHLPYPIIDFILLLSGFTGRVVVHWHSDIVKQKRLGKLLKPLFMHTLRRADTIIVSAPNNLKSARILHQFSDKCVIIPYGIDTSVTIPQKNILEQFQCKVNSFKVLFVGRFVYYKGIDVLIRAIDKVENCELFLVGDGKLRTSLEHLVHSLHLESKVHFCGRLPSNDVNSALFHCDVLVLPSVETSEAFGLVQLEAMKMSKPVINTWLKSGVPEVSRDGISGITVSPNDADALSEAISTLAADCELRYHLGSAGRRRVVDIFDEKLMAERIYRCWRGDDDFRS